MRTVSAEFGSVRTKVTYFSSLTELHGHVSTASTSRSFARWGHTSSKDHDRSTRDFTGTWDLSEALEMLAYGWPEGAEKLEAAYELTREFEGREHVDVPCHDVAGFAPDVAAWLGNQPLSMHSVRRVQKPSKAIELVRTLSYAGCVDTDKVIEQGAKALAIADSLERAGYRVGIHVAAFMGDGSTMETDLNVSGYVVRVKSPNQRIAPGVLAFAMAHPSMFRRVFFRCEECDGDLEDSFAKWDYGFVVRSDHMLDAMHSMFSDAYVLPVNIPDGYLPKTISELEERFCIRRSQ